MPSSKMIPLLQIFAFNLGTVIERGGAIVAILTIPCVLLKTAP